MAWDERAPHSLSAFLYRARISPPLGRDKAFGIENFLSHPSQSVGRSKVTMPYWGRRLSWNSSLDNSVPLRQWVIAVSHAPLSIALQRQFNPDPYSSSFLLARTAFSASSRCFRPSLLDICTQPLCVMYLRSIPPRSKPTKTYLDALEVLYARSVKSQGVWYT